MTQYRRRYWFAVHPDISKPIGGVKQIHRLAEALISLGRNVHLIQDSIDFHPAWFDSDLPVISFLDFRSLQDLHPSTDVIILPETFLSILPQYFPGIPKIIFNQNGSYSFGLPPNHLLAPNRVIELYRHPDVKSVLCVSQHDYRLLCGGLASSPNHVFRIFNSIEANLFTPSNSHKTHAIAYMPRKQSGQDVSIVNSLLNVQPWFHTWSLCPIDGFTQQQVADVLRSCLVFFAFSQREGFGLPLAEAVASGCFLIGHSGLGGDEIFSLASRYQTSEVVRDGDWFGFVDALSRFRHKLVDPNFQLSQRLLASSKLVRSTYSPSAMLSSISAALPRIESLLS